MQVQPPDEFLLAQQERNLLDLYGRMRTLARGWGFDMIQPAIWQCSDESQGIKRALFGYVFDCPVFNLGRDGVVEPTRLLPAFEHGRDIVIIGGSHIGRDEENGINCVERINGRKTPCCDRLYELLRPYLDLYEQASRQIRLFHEVGGLHVEIPYKYLFRVPIDDRPRIRIHVEQLTDGNPLRDSSYGQIFRANPQFIKRNATLLKGIGREARSIDSCLSSDLFHFLYNITQETTDPDQILETSLFDYLPEVVTSSHPMQRLADINSWRQFHLLASEATEFFAGTGRNVFILAGRTIDQSLRHNTFIAQFAFYMDQGDPTRAIYYGPVEINKLLDSQEVSKPEQSFLSFAGLSE